MNVSPLAQGMLKPDGTVDVAALQVLLNDLRNAAVTLYGSGTTAQRPRDPFPYQFYYDTTTGQYLYCSTPRNGATAAVWTPIGGGGSGTVTSVDQSVPVEFSVSGNPVTTAGTLAIAKVNQNANRVWAGPSSGAAAQPTFRALVAADIPAAAPSGWFSLTDGATITPDCNNGPKQLVTLGGNRTFAAPTNAVDGFELWLLIKQDGTGTRTATWNSAYLFFGSGSKTLTTGASKIDMAACVYNSTDAKWYCNLVKDGA